MGLLKLLLNLNIIIELKENKKFFKIETPKPILLFNISDLADFQFQVIFISTIAPLIPSWDINLQSFLLSHKSILQFSYHIFPIE